MNRVHIERMDDGCLLKQVFKYQLKGTRDVEGLGQDGHSEIRMGSLLIPWNEDGDISQVG